MTELVIVQFETQDKEKKSFAQKMKNAFVQMAQSAAFIPVVGFIIAAGILAAIGIATAVGAASASSNDDADDSIAQTRENLNQLQADLYNLNAAKQNVGKLADEFDTLSSKIFKSNEELSRLDEIAKQINDEAGRAVVTLGASAEIQFIQIKGYQAGLERDVQNKIEEINNEIGAGLANVIDAKSYGGYHYDMSGNLVSAEQSRASATQYYADQIKNDSAFINSIRAVGANEIAALSTVSSAASDAILDLLVDNIGKNGILTEQGIDTSAFKDLFGGNTGFNQFAAALDSAMESKTFSGYVAFYESLSEAQKQMVADSVPVIAAVKNISKEAAKSFDRIGFSGEELNTLWNTIAKTQEALGENAIDFDILSMDLSENDVEAKRQIYSALVDAELAYAEESKRILAMSNAELEALAASNSDNLDAQYARALKQKERLEAELTELESEIDDTKDEEDRAELEKERDKKLEALGAANTTIEEVTDAAKNSVATINELANILGIVTTTELIENFTKLASAMERIGQVSDIASLSLKEQLEILQDYPEVFDGIQRGYLTAAESMSLYEKELNSSIQSIEDNKGSLKYLYETGTGDIVSSEQWGEYADMFADTEEGAALRSSIASISLGYDSPFVDMLYKQGQAKFGEQYSLEDARNAALKVQSHIQQWNENELLAERLKTEGITALMNEQAKEAWANARSIEAANRATINALNEELEYIDKNSEEYIAKFKERNQKLGLALEHSNNTLKDIEAEKTQILTKSEYGDLAEYVDFIDGQAYLNAKTTEGLSDNMLNYIASVIPQLNDLAEKYADTLDQIAEDSELAAQTYIDSQTAMLEASIEANEKEIEALEDKKTKYEEYFDAMDALADEQERAQTREDILSQLSAIAGGSDAASSSKRKELLAQLADIDKEEAEARREEQRQAFIASIDEEITTLNEEIESTNQKIDLVNDSLGAILHAISNGKFKIDVNETTGDIQIMQNVGTDQNPIWESYKPYSSGGIVDYTGMAMVHGTPNKPEAFLNSKDTQNMRLLMDALNAVIKNSFSTSVLTNEEVDNEHVAVNVENITIKTDELNNEQDFKNSGQILAEEFAKAIRQRGMNINVKK